MKEFILDLDRGIPAVQLAFNLTGDCNLSCNYCAVRPDEINNHNNFNPEQIRKIYEDVREFHPDSFLEILCLAKGEPLINWEAIDAIDNIRQKDNNLSCFLPTNGTLDDGKLSYLAKRDWLIQISYDGVNNETTRGKTRTVKKAIRRLSKTDGARYIVRMTLTSDNINHAKESLDQIKLLGASFVSLGPVAKLGRNEGNEGKINIKDFVDSMIYAKSIGLNPLTPIKEPCSLAIRGYYFNQDGKVSMCYTRSTSPDYGLRQVGNRQGCILVDLETIFQK